MPRMHPLGVPVMTVVEFFAAEDEKAGVEPGTQMEKFFTEFAEEERRWGDDLKSNMLDIVRKELRLCPECYPGIPMPETLVCTAVLDYQMSIKSSTFEALMIAKIQEVMYFYTVDMWYYSGDFYEPPSEEWMIECVQI